MDLPNQPPVAGFGFIPSGLGVSFTDTSSDPDGSVVGWQWDFGDSNTSTSQSPTHTYATAGTYTVSLTATDNDGAATTTSQDVTVASSGTGPFIESGGLVVMEAENYGRDRNRIDGRCVDRGDTERRTGDATAAR